MRPTCAACDNNASWILRGEFVIEDEHVTDLFLCQDHYNDFTDNAPIELLEDLMKHDVKTITIPEK